MNKEFKVQAISEKINVLEINGQGHSYNCLHNCPRDRWVGNSSRNKKGCSMYTFYDAYRTVNY